ncbi:Rhs-family protein [uncultured Candidatus Thioglobus sp.]|nr:Rhs-family protein [uncultured Candidatus Thioglobus sp.]
MTNRLATNATQHIVWRWKGEAFGNTPAQELIGISVNLRFPGQYFDEETNLHYNHFRYYDPELGRYITSDPIGLKGGLNTYSYVDANPLMYYDLEGKHPVAIGILVWVGICAGISFDKGMSESFSKNVNPDLPPSNSDDKKRHCYSSCLMTQCMLGIPAAPAVGIIKEFVDIFTDSNEIDDIRANNVGVGYGYARKNCKKSCDGPDSCE